MASRGKVQALNSLSDAVGLVNSSDISQRLQKTMIRIKGSYMREDGKTVDYAGISKSEEYKEYCQLVNSLQSVDPSAFRNSERMAFFINVYNALTVHSIIEASKQQEVSSVLEVPEFWSSYGYYIGGFLFTLDDLEHGLLRKNKVHPSTGQAIVPPDDPKLKFALDTLDPRLHFALNCGAQSCPAIQVYSEDNLDRALDQAAQSYLQQEVHVDKEQNRIILPQLLEWYGDDFAPKLTERIRWIVPYLRESQRQPLQDLISVMESGGQVDINYRYEWKLNKI